ncbi:MAG TPA: glycosyltransferase family 2 protein [Candidatus Paceibacterota bacterium]
MPVKQQFNLPFVVIFVTAYNEGEIIDKVIAKVKGELNSGKYQNFYSEIIVVNDGSKDNTGEAAKAAGVRVITHPKNKGLGAATRTGMQIAYEMGADVAVKIDGDDQLKPEDIIKIINPIIDGRADVVFGSRFMGGLEYEMERHKSMGNKFFSWLTSTMTGTKVTDSAAGLIAFDRRYLERFNLLMDYNETQQLIIDSWGKKMRVIEVPISMAARKTGKSFISWKYPRKVIPAMLRAYIQVKPLRAFFIIGFTVFLLGLVVGIRWALGFRGFVGDVTATILMITGIQIILFGFVADIIVHKR